MNTQDKAFIDVLWKYYDQHVRIMPWRLPEHDGSFDFYKILVSEFMLQQTQVDRVTPKFNAFIQNFPTLQHLANATLEAVLLNWQGLGYNRRAKYLLETAKYLQQNGLPKSPEELTRCKGIGINTAAAIFTYAYNQPYIFIETNVRTVYIHHYFNDQTNVPDPDLLGVLSRTIDMAQPREFYWALMDYGSFLKRSGIKSHTKSKQYAKQSVFKGSVRQLRGEVLRQALHKPKVQGLIDRINDSRLPIVLEQLQLEGLIEIEDNVVQIASS